MSDLQITQLTSLPEAGIQSVDVAAVADISASETKKVTIKDFVAAGITLIDDASIPGAKIGVLSSNQVNTGAIIDSAVTNAKLANSSITLGGVSISLGSNDASPSFNLADATGYPTSSLSGTITNAQLAGSITGAKISDSTITYAKLNISDGDIPGAKITGTSITAGQLASDSVTAAKIAENAVGASEIGSAVITSSHVAANTLTADNLAPNCIGTSELSSSSVETGAIQDNAITTAKILNANVTAGKLAANLPGSILATGAISSTQLAENSVTASELADNSVDTNAIANSAVTDGKIASGITGTKITDGTITPAKLNTSNLDRSLNVDGGNLGINNVITAGTASGISYNAQGLITGVVALAASDIPIATTSAVGGVSVGAGLAITGAGALSIANSITGATVSGITFNSQGQITAATGLSASDIPAATTSAKGAVQITSGGGLTVDGTGNLSTSTSGVSSGTYQSVTVNEKGVITAGAVLTNSLIPNLSASKITSGTFDATRIAAGSIDGTRLSNNSTTVFQSVAQSGFPEPQFSGQMLFDTVDEDAYIYDGTAWQAITTLTKGSLTFGGTYDADQQKVVSVTVAGAAAGLTANADLPVASAQTDGVYVVVEKQGTPSGGNAPQQLLVPPDYILGVTASGASSWREVDLSSTVSQQTASNITFSAGGDIVASTVQAAIEEVDTEKLAKAGGTVTGQLLIGTAGSLVFEGATDNAHELTLSITDPTADRTLTLPNITGTVITSGDTNTVTSTMIDGSIANANIAANAAIALSKLVTVTSGNFLIGAATSGTITSVGITGDISIDNNGLAAIATGSIVNADINASAAIAGSKIVAGTTSVIGVVQLVDSATSTSTTLAATGASVKVAKDAADTAQSTADAALPKTGGTLTGDLILDDANELRLNEPTVENEAKHYTGLKAQAQSGDITLTLPAVAPTAGQVLKADASTPTTLTWASDSATDSTKMPLSGGTFTDDVALANTKKVNFNHTSGVGASIKHESGHLEINNDVGNVYLDSAGTHVLRTNGSTTALTLDTSQDATFEGHIKLPDYKRIYFGSATTPDFSIYHHSGGTTYLATTNTSGNLVIDNSSGVDMYLNSGNDINLRPQGSENGIQIIGNAGVKLFYDGATDPSFETISTGAKVTGKLLIGTDTAGSSGADEFTINTSSGHGGMTIRNDSSSNGNIWFSDGTSGAAEYAGYVQYDHNADALKVASGAALALTLDSSQNATFTGTCTATSFSGSGASLTSLDASNISSGTLSTGVLPTIPSGNIPTLNQDTTGTADKATNIAVADESTDTTCFPLFSTDATGTAVAAKSSASKLTFNSNTGALSATSFNGTLVGDGSAITNLPSTGGGSITATASGALTAGDKVIVNSDGTVSKVAEGNQEINGYTASSHEEEILDEYSEGSRIAYVSDGDYYVVAYTKDSNNSNEEYLRIRIATVDRETHAITLGSETNLHGTSKVCDRFDLAYDPDAGKVLIMSWESGENELTTRYVYSNNGSTVSKGTAGVLDFGNDQIKKPVIAYHKGIDKFVMLYEVNSALKARVGTPSNIGASNASVSWTSETEVFDEAVIDLAITADTTSSFLLTFYAFNASNLDTARALAISISGTTISTGSVVELATIQRSTQSYYAMTCFHEEEQLFLTFYTNYNSEGPARWARTISVSGNTVTANTAISTNSSYSTGQWGDLIYDPYIKKLYLYTSKSSDMDTMSSRKVEINSTTSISIDNDANDLTIYTAATEGYGATQVTSVSQLDAVNGGGGNDRIGMNNFVAAGPTHHLIAFCKNSGNSNNSTTNINGVTVQERTTTMTAGNYVGTAKENYANNTTATINVAGSIDTNQSGLTAGQKYYVQANNTLATSPDSIVSVEAGIALSATNLLVKG